MYISLLSFINNLLILLYYNYVNCELHSLAFYLVPLFNHRKYPEWDKPRICPATEVIQVRQELTRVEEILKEKQAERKVNRKHMDKQWEEARKQELLLRQSFVKFNTLVKENVEKCERAEQKIKEEHEHQEKHKLEVRTR